jgi:hypothetical protein
VTRLLCALLLLSPIVSAAEPCAMIPIAQISGMLGTTKNKGMANMQLPPKATEGKACTYAGKDNSATVILFRFSTPVAARDYLKTVRDGFEKQSIPTTSEKLGGEDGFSFSSGMLAVKKNVWLRVNVYSTAGKVVSPDLTRQLTLFALQAN